jgi:ribosomal protein S28E/S33
MHHDVVCGLSGSKIVSTLSDKRQRQILRKIFGPVNIDNVWRIRNNMEIDELALYALN